MAKKLNVLIVGSGGRESAFGWAVKKSPRCGKLYSAPGNGGTALIGENVPVAFCSIAGLIMFAVQKQIGLAIIGPELAIAEGLVDSLRAANIPVVGPTKRAGKIETSKVFAKNLMEDWNIPTAPYRVFRDMGPANACASSHSLPMYVKASGLCGGQGAVLCTTRAQARKVAHDMLTRRIYGDGGAEIVIEDALKGEEVSVHAFCNGVTHVLAPYTQDHKRLLPDGQFLSGRKNPNTGGMGAVGPVHGFEQYADDIDLIVERTLRGIQDRLKEPYTGILYPGLMMTVDGPKVLEFNARGGDPETQVLMRLLKSDALDLFEMIATGSLGQKKVEWHDDLFAVCVVLVSGGYPGKYETKFFIRDIDEAEQIPGVVVFHAGTRLDTLSGLHFTSGGRVLNVTATGSTLREALDRAYEGAALINFEGKYYRRDIGKKALEHSA